MKIEIESTSKIVTLITKTGEVPARIWEGKTASGIPVHCYITRIAIAEGLETTEFARELREQRAPSPVAGKIPSRLIL